MSKGFFDVAYRSDTGQFLYLGQYDNNQKGYKALIKQLKTLTTVPLSEWFICFENTGAYSKAFLKFLCDKSILRREENATEICRSLGIRRAKTDKLDAIAICKYAYGKRDFIEANVIDSADISKIKKLLSVRELLVKQRKALKVHLKDTDPNLDQDFVDHLQVGNKKLIKNYNDQIKGLDKQILQIMASDVELSKSFKLACSVVGIGPVTGAYVIAFTNNFTKIIESRKFACYSGIAPFPNSSGLFKGQNKVSHLANKAIKALLSNCINAAIQHDPQIKKYYHRKLEEGKKKGVVFNAIKNKLVHRVFAVVKRGTPYVKLSTYA